MPTTYAHYRFGRNVYKQLPTDIQDMIRSHGGLYNIGLHGPDLLFYYRVFEKNAVNQTGFAMHARPGAEFFRQAALVIHSSPFGTGQQTGNAHRADHAQHTDDIPQADDTPQADHMHHTDDTPQADHAQHTGRQTSHPYITSAKYTYLFGFLCHFALDSNCHPYVERMVRETGISHSEIEAELDRNLMLRDGLDPMTCRPTFHLKAKVFYGSIISGFFPGITVRQIVTSIRHMRICCNLLAPSGRWLRFVTRRLMKTGRIPYEIQDMVIKENANPACAPIVRELERLYSRAVPDAAELIVNFMEHVEKGAPLDSRLEHTFGEE